MIFYLLETHLNPPLFRINEALDVIKNRMTFFIAQSCGVSRNDFLLRFLRQMTFLTVHSIHWRKHSRVSRRLVNLLLAQCFIAKMINLGRN